MKRFLLNSIVFGIFLLSFLGFLFSSINFYTDSFYKKFTSPKQNNLLLGTSRAAQGLQPQVFNEILNRQFYNYAFTVAHSPYGAVYLKSIKKKINKNATDGIFILSVDPWGISSTTLDPDDFKQFRELNLCLATTPIVNFKPNFFYLINNYQGKLFLDFLLNKSSTYLHDDGWAEVSVNMDSSSVAKRTKNKLHFYRTNNLPDYKYSNLRLEYLKKTIHFLSNHGKVYLVRLPIHPEMLLIENELMPDFNAKIQALIPLTSGYLDMTVHNYGYDYTDGNHLYKESGRGVSKEISNWIKQK